MAIAGLGLLVGDVTTAGAILRPDYATGPGLAFPLETLQAIALCIRHGIVIRDPDAIERLATADLLVLDHHARSRTHRVGGGRRRRSSPVMARKSCSATPLPPFHDLDDERAAVLRGACLARGIAPLGLQPIDFATDVTLLHGNDRIKVGDLGSRARGLQNRDNQRRLHAGPNRNHPIRSWSGSTGESRA